MVLTSQSEACLCCLSLSHLWGVLCTATPIQVSSSFSLIVCPLVVCVGWDSLGGMKLSDIFGTGCTFWAYARFLHRPGPLRATSLFFRLSIKTELTENVDRFNNLRESPIFK